MKNELTAGHGFLQGVRFTQIAQGGLCFEVGDIVCTAARAHQQAQIGALFSQRMSNMAADKPGGSCNEDFHALCLKSIMCSRIQVLANHVFANPGCQFVFFELSRRQPKNLDNGIHLACVKTVAFAGQKNADGEERGPLVSVVKRMVPGHTKTVGSGKPGNVINSVIRVQVTRPRQCRLQKPSVPHTFPTAMLRQALRVQENDSSLADPPKPAHFASALNVSRYFFMNSRPSLRSSSISFASSSLIAPLPPASAGTDPSPTSA